MSSFSRSGETLMLRCLSAHPDIHIVHNLVAPPESEECFDLFRLIQAREETTIPSDHPKVIAAGASDKKVLVVKNAIWEHKYPYNGFVLARNPLSVVQSFKLFKEDKEKSIKRKTQYARWMDGIDPRLKDCLNIKNNVVLLCALYNRKMFPLTNLDLPVVRYEEFVENHEKYLRDLVRHFGLEWTDQVLKSHEHYKEGDYGHGKLPLWKDIHQNSSEKYKKLPDSLISMVHGLTYPTLTALGYEFDSDYTLTLK